MRKPTELEEKTLTEKARKGDKDAFNRLVEIFTLPLIGHILARIGGSRSDAEDIAQEVWLAAAGSIRLKPQEGGFDIHKGGYYNYLINRYAKFKIRQWKQKQKRNREYPFPADREFKGLYPQIKDSDESSSPDALLHFMEEREQKAKQYWELLRIVFLCGGLPHQQISFLYSKIIYGRKSPRGIEGNPKKVNERHGAESLNKLHEKFWKCFKAAAQIDESIIEGRRHYSDPLKKRLQLKVQTLVGNDSRLMKYLAKILNIQAAETNLADYYAEFAGGYSTAVPDWCYKVERRIRTVLSGKGDSCRRCKLKNLPPCSDSSTELKKIGNEK